MNTSLKSAGLGALLAVLLACGATAAMASAVLPLGSSPEIPAAQGDVHLRNTRNGNTEIRLRYLHLAPPGRIVSGTDVFVVWIRGLAPDAQPQSLGALRVDKNLSAKLTATTAMASFDLFITCEESQTVTSPASLELLPFHYAAP
jgi:hypothetical protein